MIIGVLKEIKNHEYRVSTLPSGVEALTKHGHKVYVQSGAGGGTGISDEDYANAGAEILSSAKQVFEKAEMIVKVKEPQESEYPMLRKGQIVFTYFHFAASKELTTAMLNKEIVAIAYETIMLQNGHLPLLTPMSEVAGRMAIQEGARYLSKPAGGIGILLAGVPGVPPAKVVIIGAGVVGINAAKVAAGMGAIVTVLDINIDKLRFIDDTLPANVRTLFSNPHTLKKAVKDADLVVGAVLVAGAKAPVLITRALLREMKPGTVIVDVAVDQGGCVETTRPTTHENPVYIEEGIVHYCVANMPGAVPKTSSYALANATFPYLMEIANKGYIKAGRENQAIARGINMVEGTLTNSEIAQAFNLKYTEIQKVLW